MGLLLLGVFEILRVYFIMPLPGSQQWNTIDLAYALHGYRWYIRIFCLILILFGLRSAFSTQKKWLPIVMMIIVMAIIYAFNFQMTAEKMFREPTTLSFATQATTNLKDSTTVLAVVHEGEAKAYPIRYIIYHHQVRDSLAGKPIMVTYCSVCRTGRVFDPHVNGQLENFRLVGMDHFNAMFEDASTKSWWMQATGEAVAGPLKGNTLSEIESSQLTLQKYFQLFPFGKVMQPDETFITSYDTLGKYEWGNSTSHLTGTDSLSWNEKSWVVGIQYGGTDRAYDWNLLKEKRILHDTINNTGIAIVLASDNQTFTAFKRNSDEQFSFRNDTLLQGTNKYTLTGQNLSDSVSHLERIQAYQEFWHSWRTFHPNTTQYGEK